MFDETIRNLSKLIKPLDYVSEKDAKEITVETIKAVLNEIKQEKGIEPFLADVMIRDEVRGGIYIAPFVSSDDFHFKVRPHAIKSFVYKNGKPPNSRGLWLWAFAFDNSTAFWINDIQLKEKIRFGEIEAKDISLLDPNYLMLTGETPNLCKGTPYIPTDSIVFGKTNSIIIIPLIHKHIGETSTLGILSMEIGVENFSKEIFQGLNKISKWLGGLLWRLETSKFILDETDKAVSEFSDKIEEWYELNSNRNVLKFADRKNGIFKHLSSLIQPLDFIELSSAQKVIVDTLSIVKKEIKNKTGIDLYLIDVMIKEKANTGVNLTPIASSKEFRITRNRHQARQTFAHKNGRPSNERGIWLWALAYDKAENIWINNIPELDNIHYDDIRVDPLPELEPGYRMLIKEVLNEADKENNLPSDIIVYDKTESIIIIPLIHKGAGGKIKVGLLSVESSNGNLNAEIYTGLVKIAKWITGILWRLEAKKFLSKETKLAIGDYINNVSISRMDDDLQKSLGRLKIQPVFKKIKNDIYKNDVFVVMPFREKFVNIFETNIKKVVINLGYSIAKGNDFFTAETIMNEVWTSILEAKLIIADCTGRNPNVFYELGIAHAIGKKVVIITQDEKDIPFDINHIRYITYEDSKNGRDKLELKLAEALKQFL